VTLRATLYFFLRLLRRRVCHIKQHFAIFKLHVRPEYARRRKAEKAEGGLGWKTQAWKQALFENMNLVIARSNYAMLAMHTLPHPMYLGRRRRCADDV